ncbi:hypothetical protein P0136_05815 [Lentisphaerota bacterium ZTH]|nr:hypothetical protein JYG24_03070 [Lentisphaerota bacterium]WET07508.1 hypothetical protein P0136_05815 [Lentisphaerota bacterium ZTH]
MKKIKVARSKAKNTIAVFEGLYTLAKNHETTMEELENAVSKADEARILMRNSYRQMAVAVRAAKYISDKLPPVIKDYCNFVFDSYLAMKGIVNKFYKRSGIYLIEVPKVFGMWNESFSSRKLNAAKSEKLANSNDLFKEMDKSYGKP